METLIFFAYPLAGSLLIQVPGLSDRGLGTGQAILAAGLTALAITDLTRWQGEPNDPRSWRLTHLIPSVLIAALAITGTIATLTTSIGGLYWLAVTIATAITSGLINSWVLLVEIKR